MGCLSGPLRDRIDVTQRIRVINRLAPGAEAVAMELRQLGPRSARWAALRSASSSGNVVRAIMLTGWGRTLTTWTPRSTAHAVDPEQVDRCLAVCGAELVVINLARPWSGEDATDLDACRRCTTLVA